MLRYVSGYLCSSIQLCELCFEYYQLQSSYYIILIAQTVVDLYLNQANIRVLLCNFYGRYRIPGAPSGYWCNTDSWTTKYIGLVMLKDYSNSFASKESYQYTFS